MYKFIKLFQLFFVQFALLFDYWIWWGIFSYLTKLVDIFLIESSILFIFDSFKTVKQFILHQIRCTNEIYDSFTQQINQLSQLIFQLIKIRIKLLLDTPTIRFVWTFYTWKNLHTLCQLMFRYEFLLTIMCVILFDTLLTATGLFPLAMLRNAELVNWHVMLAFVHLFTDYNNLLLILFYLHSI